MYEQYIAVHDPLKENMLLSSIPASDLSEAMQLCRRHFWEYYYMKHIDSIRCRKDEVNYYIDCNPSLTQFWLNVFVAGTDDKVQKHITVYMIDKCPSKWMELKEKYDKKQRQYFIQGQQMIKNGEKLIAEGKELCKEDKMLFYMGDSVIQDFAHTLYTCNNNK